MMGETGGRSGRRLLWAALMAGAAFGAGLGPVPAYAQSSEASQRQFNIPAQGLPDALTLFGRQSGMQVSVHGDLVRGLSSPGVSGTLAPVEALSRLLAGTGITFRVSGNTAILERAPRVADGAVVLGAVRVEGSDEGAGGGGGSLTSDPAASEGTGSYSARATTIGKTAESLRDIPQSVSVITRQRLEDQNLVSLVQVLDKVPGVTALTYGWGGTYLSRGYSLQAQYDGMSTTGGLDYSAQFDMAMYDRVEVMRGPAGMFNGSSSPGGTVNLVRKRPRKEAALSVAASVGSWNNFHGELDASLPLNADGSIRARAVLAGLDRDSFIDEVHRRALLAYGIVEFDISPETIFSISAATQYHKEGPLTYGIPTLEDGTPYDDRSLYGGADWSYMKQPSTEVFADLTHSFNSVWKIKAALRYRKSGFKFKYGYVNGAIDPETYTTSFFAAEGDQPSRLWNGDINLSGSFNVFGKEHQILIGADFASGSGESYGQPGVWTSDVYVLDPDIPEPSFGDLYLTAESKTRQQGLYGRVTLNPTDSLTIIGGGRVSWYKYDSVYDYYGWFSGESHLKSTAKFSPYGGITYDITKQITVYASYTDIFIPQSAMTVTGSILPPRIGFQYEGGVKGEFYDGALNMSLAAFRLRDTNRSYSDPDNPGFALARGKVQSQGIEAEITGKILPGLELSAGYTYLETEYLEDRTNEGNVFSPAEPKHSFKLWGNYNPATGPLEDWSFGLGLKAVSKFTSTASPAVKSTGYVVASAQIGHDLTDNIKLSATVNNIFDKKYLERVWAPSGGNYWGEPRSFMLTARAGF